MSDVAMVGVGIHPFGRHKGVTALEQLDFGMKFEVVVRPFTVAEDGTEVYTFGFAPAGQPT